MESCDSMQSMVILSMLPLQIQQGAQTIVRLWGLSDKKPKRAPRKKLGGEQEAKEKELRVKVESRGEVEWNHLDLVILVAKQNKKNKKFNFIQIHPPFIEQNRTNGCTLVKPPSTVLERWGNIVKWMMFEHWEKSGWVGWVGRMDPSLTDTALQERAMLFFFSLFFSFFYPTPFSDIRS